MAEWRGVCAIEVTGDVDERSIADAAAFCSVLDGIEDAPNAVLLSFASLLFSCGLSGVWIRFR